MRRRAKRRRKKKKRLPRLHRLRHLPLPRPQSRPPQQGTKVEQLCAWPSGGFPFRGPFYVEWLPLRLVPPQAFC